MHRARDSERPEFNQCPLASRRILRLAISDLLSVGMIRDGLETMIVHKLNVGYLLQLLRFWCPNLGNSRMGKFDQSERVGDPPGSDPGAEYN